MGVSLDVLGGRGERHGQHRAARQDRLSGKDVAGGQRDYNTAEFHGGALPRAISAT